MHFFAYYLTTTFSPSSYNLGSSLVSKGLQWWHGMIAAVIGSIFLSIVVVLNSRGAAKYHVGFPEFACLLHILDCAVSGNVSAPDYSPTSLRLQSRIYDSRTLRRHGMGDSRKWRLYRIIQFPNKLITRQRACLAHDLSYQLRNGSPLSDLDQPA